MVARVSSATLLGVDAHPVSVEANRGPGLPGVTLIGLARGAVKESLVRVRAALCCCGIELSSWALVANLLPAELPKEASCLDLALAMALMAAKGDLSPDALRNRRFFGELSLGGRLEPVRGAAVAADLARRLGDREIIVPLANAAEAAVVPDISVKGAETLGQVIAHLRGEQSLATARAVEVSQRSSSGCLSEVKGQALAKRALEIAAAGGHNLLMIGPPGSGKTMLARRLPGLLPHLSPSESLEVTRIHSAAGLLQQSDGLMRQRPFRAPHHTASHVALCGGGSTPRPGEITLAHRGVLFLDELPEFSRRALESMREPLEEGYIQISRAALSLRFPAHALLVAAMNPCPCGYYGAGGANGSAVSECMCSFDQIHRYRSRISGPLLDRIDLHVAVTRVPYADFSRECRAETSKEIRKRVLRARRAQSERLGEAQTNATMDEQAMNRHVGLDKEQLRAIETAIERYGLSTRAVNRIRKVARTVADLEGTPEVTVTHLKEAMSFRLIDKDLAASFADNQLRASA